MADRIEIPLELDDFDVMASDVVDGVLEVQVKSTFPAACFHCGSVDVVGHGHNMRRLRDRSRGQPTVLVWHQRRLACRDCGRTSRERHPHVSGRRSITTRLRRQLFDEACARPFAEVALAHGVTHYRVVEAFDALAPGELGDVGNPRVLALDESAFRRQLRFNTVLFDPVARRGLAVEEGRTQRTAEILLFGLSPQVRAGVETVVIDCHWPYRKAIEEAMPQARIVADKFHVMRAVSSAAQRVRRRHGRRTRVDVVGRDGGTSRQHHPRNSPVVFGSRWSFMRRVHNLTPFDRVVLDVVFTAAPDVAAAYWMKEAFAAIYDAETRDEAERRLDVWVHNLAAGDREFRQLWTSLRWWRQEILNYFDDRQTNAFAEGITNKVKVMKRRGYGYRNAHRYGQKVLLTCRPTEA